MDFMRIEAYDRSILLVKLFDVERVSSCLDHIPVEFVSLCSVSLTELGILSCRNTVGGSMLNIQRSLTSRLS